MNEIYVLRDKEPVQVPDLAKYEGVTRVAFTELEPGLVVSTVFLGVDHRFGGGPPLLFETMAFSDGESVSQDRHSTWEEAERGHQATVDFLRHRS